MPATGCAGPQLHIDNPGRDDLFVDGTAMPAIEHGTLGFRYYGTVRWRALPRDDGEGVPRFDRLAASGEIEVEAPVSPWLFPLDFPLELVHRLFVGQRDQFLTVELPEAPASDGAGLDIPPDQLGALRQRAEAARTAR
ncbi:MAG: hypothetical protein H6835_08300 [Planctomycetes bacterium]|nr:hypothetical protein [Planctomycetota bacterium]